MTNKDITGWMLIVLASVMLSAQQTAPNEDHPDKTQIESNQPNEQQLSVTTDGTPACSKEFELRTIPKGVYRVGGGVAPPKATKSPEAHFSDEARKEARKFVKSHHLKNFEAVSIVRLTVDTEGKPGDICIVKEAGFSLDRQAYQGVEQYRFQPATLNGEPIPVRIEVAVKFKLW
jgi:protein TonB